jgi:uncharacterized protein (DUF1697 family)
VTKKQTASPIAYAALLRAVNVAGTNKLPMADLVKLCVTAGFADARTWIQSGNVVFTSPLDEAAIVTALETALAKKMKKPIGVLVRTAAELATVVARNPFPAVAPNLMMVTFLPDAPPADAIAGWKIPGREQLVLDGRHIYIHFPDGQGGSKLKIPFGDRGTVRNLNTVNKLLELTNPLLPVP